MDEVMLRQTVALTDFVSTMFHLPEETRRPVSRTSLVRVLGYLCLVLACGLTSSAQDTDPPPGFSPENIEKSSSIQALDAPSHSDPGSESSSLDPPSLHAYPNRTRVFPYENLAYGQRPASLFGAGDEPALPKVWFRSEALLWWTKGSPLSVPLVTKGSLDDPVPGALGQPGTSVVMGNENVDFPNRWGGRFTLGFSFNTEQTWGIEGTYFFLPNEMVTQSLFSNGGRSSDLLSFPFFNAKALVEDATPISLPGVFPGQAFIAIQNILQGTDVNLLHSVLNAEGIRVDLLGGFRYINFQEDLQFSTDSPNVYPNPPGFFHTFDEFMVNNDFYGGQLGVRASINKSRFFANATGKLAMGSTVQNVSIDGGTFTNIGRYASARGGYLSQPTNIGSTSHSQFAVVPELNLNVGIRLVPWASIIVGYSFLYISSVARTGDQIDRAINPTQSSAITTNFPGYLSSPARPGATIHGTDFWAQGLNFALEFRF